jgi:hypothetical protein
LAAEAWLYLALAVGTGLMSLALLAGWLGPALALGDPVLWATTAVVAVFILVERGSLGWPSVASCLAATLLLGPGCGLSLFLFLRASNDTGGARPAFARSTRRLRRLDR